MKSLTKILGALVLASTLSACGVKPGPQIIDTVELGQGSRGLELDGDGQVDCWVSENRPNLVIGYAPSYDKKIGDYGLNLDRKAYEMSSEEVYFASKALSAQNSWQVAQYERTKGEPRSLMQKTVDYWTEKNPGVEEAAGREE